jgi:hypothetical protein
MKWTSLLAQGWTKIPGAQQLLHEATYKESKINRIRNNMGTSLNLIIMFLDYKYSSSFQL